MNDSVMACDAGKDIDPMEEMVRLEVALKNCGTVVLDNDNV